MPMLTELERTKLENYTLKIMLMQNQVQQLTNERLTFIRQIEEDHPGFEWNEAEGLVPKEEEFEPVLT